LSVPWPSALLGALLVMPAGVVAAQSDVQWITLGTVGGPAVQQGAAQIANALVVGDDIYLFDVGDGVRQQMARAGLAPAQIRAVFLSHHHVDHTADLGPLLVSNWLFNPQNRIAVVGPAGTATLVDGLVAAYAPTVLASFPIAGPAKPTLSSTVEARDLPHPVDPARMAFENDQVRVLTITVDHFQVPPSVPLREMPEAVAYRIEAEGQVIVYTGDTGPSERLEALAQDADLLVSEVVDIEAMSEILRQSMKDAPGPLVTAILGNLDRNHLTPEYIGGMAERAGVCKVVLTHYVPVPRSAGGYDAYVAAVKSVYDGEVLAARDLDTLLPGTCE
jgi:ribonuclease BN (tRNA processing enzyme)